MSVLLINAGNTRCVAVRQEGGAASAPLQALLTEPTPRESAAAQDLAALLAAARRVGEPAAAASVVPQVSAALAAALPGLQLVDHTWRFPFRVAVRSAETVGADRWCNVAAAAATGLREALIVDAGTATTIDVLADGAFVGGLIAPGMAFAARQLQVTAPRLWEVPFAPCPLRPGRDTAEALRIGAFHVGVQGIVGTVAALLAQRPGSQVVVTGGLGIHVARPGWAYEPDWTLRGLAALVAGRQTA